MKIKTVIKQQHSDTVSPIDVYLKIRNKYESILLEGEAFCNNKSLSLICFEPIAEFEVYQNNIKIRYSSTVTNITFVSNKIVSQSLIEFIGTLNNSANHEFNSVFGYSNYDAIKYFEDINIDKQKVYKYDIPDIKYCYYKHVIMINNTTSELTIYQNLLDGEKEDFSTINEIIKDDNIPYKDFSISSNERSNISDNEYIKMTEKGIEHCKYGNVFQIVLSRQYNTDYTGDEFNIYRAMSKINPSPYQFFFDYGNYQIMGASPESLIRIDNSNAIINPIAGTYKRTGDIDKDTVLAQKLIKDKKENAEHVMLVDLARNDLSRNCKNVVIEKYKETKFFSHVIHLVSEVKGEIKDKDKNLDILFNTFPAGTLSGAPKYKAMEIIDKIENQNRGFYGGGIGYINLNGNINHAIIIRSILSKENSLYYQAGAGIVEQSTPQKELEEVNNKLGAVRKAISLAEMI